MPLTNQEQAYIKSLTDIELNAICSFTRHFIKSNSEPLELLQPACYLIKHLSELEEEFYSQLENRLRKVA